ncbi:GNAT family N-acetyltransferase [Caldimonas sp. KR1-144]|uniref:GNAT family N-acetyltransferase n=1 Tax=Caldimonas sp. KR1-144 TaxID=3400911 RepID=UPI003C1243BB
MSWYPGLDVLPTLEAPRLRLRMLRDGDADAIFAVFGDPQVMRYASRPAMTERAAAAAYIEGIRHDFTARRLFQWGIERRGDGAVIGTVTLFSLNAQCRRAEIGYMLGRAHWGAGFASEAVGTVVDHAFAREGLDLLRLEADIDPRNAASARLLERVGFKLEGTLRERWIVNGEVSDSGLYGLLARERAALRG